MPKSEQKCTQLKLKKYQNEILLVVFFFISKILLVVMALREEISIVTDANIKVQFFAKGVINMLPSESFCP